MTTKLSPLVIKYTSLIEIVILVGGLALAAFIMVTLTVIPPVNPGQLKTNELDQIKFWLQARKMASDQPLLINNPQAFVSPSQTP